MVSRMLNFSAGTRTSLYNAAFYLVPLTLGAGTLYYMLKVRRSKAAAQKKLEARKPAKQAEHRVPTPEAVGNGTPMFAGVRVLELATHVAAPSAGRCMADLGAEVVHVEPPAGDLYVCWRWLVLIQRRNLMSDAPSRRTHVYVETAGGRRLLSMSRNRSSELTVPLSKQQALESTPCNSTLRLSPTCTNS